MFRLCASGLRYPSDAYFPDVNRRIQGEYGVDGVFQEAFGLLAGAPGVFLGGEQIGEALVGSEKYGYVLPFEFISLFLLACIIGGLVVSRNQKEDK